MTSATKYFMEMFNNYYDYEHHNGQYISNKDYESLRSAVDNYNNIIAMRSVIKDAQDTHDKSG